MSNLSSADKEYIENALRLNTNGGAIHLLGDKFENFFEELGININDPKYSENGTSEVEKIRLFWKLENNSIVGRSILELAALFRNIELRGYIIVKFSKELEKIGNKLLSMSDINIQSVNHTIQNCKQNIQLYLNSEIFNHVKRYLDTEDYFHAVEEAYKMVRNKLKEKTGKEKAVDVFNQNAENHKYFNELFGHDAEVGTPEGDFFRGVGYLNLAIQFLRNEKSHDLAKPLDKNLALHYITLASLTYDLISRNN